MSDINVVPLADVMLVLLIIFLITTQVIKQAVPVTLPKVRYEPTMTKPENVSLTRSQRSRRQLRSLLGHDQDDPEGIARPVGAEAREADQGRRRRPNVTEENMPEAHIRGDINTKYKCIGAAIITMQQAGFQRVGFISEPPPLAGFRAN